MQESFQKGYFLAGFSGLIFVVDLSITQINPSNLLNDFCKYWQYESLCLNWGYMRNFSISDNYYIFSVALFSSGSPWLRKVFMANLTLNQKVFLTHNNAHLFKFWQFCNIHNSGKIKQGWYCVSIPGPRVWLSSCPRICGTIFSGWD